MWTDLESALGDLFSPEHELFDRAALRVGGGFHIFRRKGRAAPKPDLVGRKRECQRRIRERTAADPAKREARLAAKRACAKAAYHRAKAVQETSI